MTLNALNRYLLYSPNRQSDMLKKRSFDINEDNDVAN